MWRNPPAVKGRIQDVFDSIESDDPYTTAIMAPMMPANAVQIWAFAASHRENPDLKIILIEWEISYRSIREHKKLPTPSPQSINDHVQKLPPLTLIIKFETGSKN